MKFKTRHRRWILSATLLIGCSEDDSDPATDGASTGEDPADNDTETPDVDSGDPVDDTAAEADGGDEAEGEESDSGGIQPLDCTDQLIIDLSLVDGQTSEGAIVNEADGEGFQSTVDATAGGLEKAPTNPWLYMRFTDEGLERVDIDDLEALDSRAWHIAAKRFGIRLNSGTSGPSTVTAAPIADQLSYEDVQGTPDGTLLLNEDFYSDDCSLLEDGLGLGTPAYVLTPWWEYPGCVATTLTPFVVELPEGQRLKFVVDTYYESGQAECNASGSMGSGSANFTWRWAFLP